MQIAISNNQSQTTATNIVDRVKTFEDACEVLGIKGDVFVGVLNDGLSDVSEKLIAHTKLLIIIRALNQGWTPNWNNGNEAKFYPYWDMEKGFSLLYVSDYYLFTFVPSCLCFKSKPLAEYATKQFLGLYKTYFTN